MEFWDILESIFHWVVVIPVLVDLAVLVQRAPYRKARKQHQKSQQISLKRILKSYVEILNPTFDKVSENEVYEKVFEKHFRHKKNERTLQLWEE